MRLMLFFLLFGATLWGAEPDLAVISVSRGTVHKGDYFGVGSQIEISGVVTGDAYLFGGQTYVDGRIEGDLIIVCGSVDVSGEVMGNIRVIAGQATLSGLVHRNAAIAAANVILAPSGEIQGSLVCAAGSLDLASSIGKDAKIFSSSIRLAGPVKGDVNVYAGSLRLTSRAEISGALNYRSNEEAVIDPLATVAKGIHKEPSIFHGFPKAHFFHSILIGSKIAAFLMNFIYTFVIGFILVKFFPHKLKKALHVLSSTPLKALSVGLVVLIVLPLVSLLLLMTVLGIPFALTLMAANIVGFYTAKVFSIFWVSHFGGVKLGVTSYPMTFFFVGMILYFALTAIPIFGFIIALAAMLFGMGAGIVGSTPKNLHVRESAGRG